MQDAQEYEANDVGLDGAEECPETAVELAHGGTRDSLVRETSHEQEREERHQEPDAYTDEPYRERAQFEVRGDGVGEESLGDVGTEDAARPGAQPEDALEHPFPQAEQSE